MMRPFFALVLIDARLAHIYHELRFELGEQRFTQLDKDTLHQIVRSRDQGYNGVIFERGLTLQAICSNEKTFERDFTVYLNAFDDETKEMLGVAPVEETKSLNIAGAIKLKAGGLLAITRAWCAIDLSPYEDTNTPIEEHIQRAFTSFMSKPKRSRSKPASA